MLDAWGMATKTGIQAIRAARRKKLAALLDKYGKVELSKLTDINPDYLWQMGKGEGKSARGVNDDNARKIERGTGHQPYWMDSDDDASTSPVVAASENGGGYLRVAHLEAEVDMGDGRVNADFPEVIRSIDLAEPYIRSIVGFLPPPGRLVIITGRGDSMIPTIQPGESLIVDTGVTSYDGDGLYLINLGHGQQVKRLIDHGTEAGIHVHSDNKAYPAIKVPAGAIVGGKVYLRNRIDRLN